MRVHVTPPIRLESELAEIGRSYIRELFQLVGSEGDVRTLHNEWNQTGRPATHLYNDICNKAREIAVRNLLPSEKGIVSFIHRYE